MRISRAMQFKYMYQQQPSQVCFGKSCSTYSKKVGAPSLQNWRFNTEHQKIDFRLGGWFSWDIFHFVRGAVFRSTWCSAKVDFTKSQLYHGIFRLGFFLNEFCWTTIFQNNPGDCFCKNLNYFWYACFSWFMVSYVLDVSHGFLWTMVFL